MGVTSLLIVAFRCSYLLVLIRRVASIRKPFVAIESNDEQKRLCGTVSRVLDVRELCVIKICAGSVRDAFTSRSLPMGILTSDGDRCRTSGHE